MTEDLEEPRGSSTSRNERFDDFDEYAEQDLEEFVHTVESGGSVRPNEGIPVGEVAVEDDNDEEYVQKNRKWFGVPPKGKRAFPQSLIPGTKISLGPGWNLTVHIAVLIIIEILLWAVYRGVSAPFFAGFGTTLFFVMHIIFAPLIHLGPIIIYWKLIRKEPGVPFMFTRKNLLTGVTLGLMAGTIWRVFQFLIYDTLAMATGIHESPMTWWNLMGGSGWAFEFALMTFVMYCIVGPVEEFEFRSFALDQIWRGKSVVWALGISSVLFGCSHIPIAIFVYKFTPLMFIAALTGWIIAGVVLGVVYVVTRNIWAAIVMHAVGNWTLSVMIITSASVGGAYTVTHMFVDIATTILADGLMFVIFLIIFKFMWKPRLLGEEGGIGLFKRLDGFKGIKSKDMGHLVKVVVMLVVINFVFLGFVMAVTTGVGTSIWDDIDGDDGPAGEFIASDYSIEPGEGFGRQSYADENTETAISFAMNISEGQYLKSVTATLTWQDEEDYQRILRTWENEPDSFGLNVSVAANPNDDTTSNLNGSVPMTENAHGSSQTISVTVEVEHQTTDSMNGNGTWEIIVMCGECKDKYASGPAAVYYNDFGNDFDLVVETEMYVDTGE